MFHDSDFFQTQNEALIGDEFGINRRGCGCTSNAGTTATAGEVRLPTCTCLNNEELLNCAQRQIFTFLGDYGLDLLSVLDMPNLNCILLALACGRRSPCQTPTLEQLLCKALREERCGQDEECIMPWLCEGQNGCCPPHHDCCNLTPRQLEGVKLYLGCKICCYLTRLTLPPTHPSLECSLLQLSYTGELPENHLTLNRLLSRALNCRCHR